MKLLVCGTRGRGSREFIKEKLMECYNSDLALNPRGAPFEFEIIEGCCPDSADEVAEEWAKEHGVKINHYPSTSGNYLKRNVEMVNACNMVFAFWDGFSYGTAHTIARATMKRKPVAIFKV